MLDDAALDAVLEPERTAELVLPERTAELALLERTAEVLPERTAELAALRVTDEGFTDAVRALVLPATSEPVLLTWVMVPREAFVVAAEREATSALRLTELLVVPMASALEALLTLLPLTVPLG